MRVLVISHGHPAFSIGGAEVASHNLFQGLGRQEDVDSFYLSRAAPPVQRHRHTPLLSLRQGANETFLFANDYDGDILSNRATHDLTGAFRRYLLDLAPDVVHFHHFIGLGVEAIFEVRRTLPRARIVITFHEYLPICLHHGQMVKTQKRQLCRGSSPAECHACFPEFSPATILERELFLKNHLSLADAYVSPSRFLIDRYVKWGLPAEKFTLIENGIDASIVAPPRVLPPGGRRSRFGFFGQVTEYKGVHILLDAIGRIPDDVWGDDASLSIFGGNLENQPQAFRDAFDALVTRAGRRARFQGSYRGEEMGELMRQVDWVVMPSIWWENSPMVIQESFLHRRPLISSDIGGMREKIEDGVSGLHFRVSSAEDLAEKMTIALTDPALWDRLSAGCPRPLDNDEVAQRHIELYRELEAARAAGLPVRAVTPAAPPARIRRKVAS